MAALAHLMGVINQYNQVYQQATAWPMYLLAKHRQLELATMHGR